ncbi:unnamed protein product [Didymodactylos carnosus]|uniref:Uncharacterized protein n=1 Tax=Didymodactylos carnosus TaxID=1234261 RepID=A0A814ZJ22_9BILA|nr:unnamed protein product [Didymodactylos carnosus]CAF1300956.1 unnamed protein product [Didymodactylos carnosus]CAF4006116.1 unnamed protein product [Didymodactylos carnosus]CAF4107198.1 unnamed protein product [Didymodactylos carnosus]
MVPVPQDFQCDQSKKKSKHNSNAIPDDMDDTLDSMLDSASKLTMSLKSDRAGRRPTIEAQSGWMELSGDPGDNEPIRPPLFVPRTSRQRAEEIVINDIPTIPTDDADGDESLDMAPQMADAPEFTAHQIASYKEIETEFLRERASQYIDSKTDIGILYQNLHLQEDFDVEEQKVWEWDKLFTEVVNTLSNLSTTTAEQ